MEFIKSELYRESELDLSKHLKKVAYFASDNGLGHIKRSIIISKYLSKFFNIIIFSNKKKIKQFDLKKKLKVKNFLFGKFKPGRNLDTSWYKKINTNVIKNSDFFICDNYPEILNIKTNKKVFIFANFFWHQILKIKKSSLLKIEKEIKRKKIRIIGNYIFQDKQIKKKFLTCGIGFLGKFQGRLNCRKNILISLGTAYLDRKYVIQFEKQINLITKNRNFENCKIYLDKIFYNKFAHYKNIYRADYSESMFKKISIAIVKPGLGIINDCLSHGIYLISVELPFNREYLNNSNLINKNRLGKNSKSLIKGFEISQNILNKKQKLKNMFYRYKKLKWNGERNLYNYIRTIIK